MHVQNIHNIINRTVRCLLFTDPVTEENPSCEQDEIFLQHYVIQYFFHQSLTFSWVSVDFDGEGCADVDTVQDGQQDHGQPEQVIEVIEAKVD